MNAATTTRPFVKPAWISNDMLEWHVERIAEEMFDTTRDDWAGEFLFPNGDEKYWGYYLTRALLSNDEHKVNKITLDLRKSLYIFIDTKLAAYTANDWSTVKDDYKAEHDDYDSISDG
jgi:hypothetical protein